MLRFIVGGMSDFEAFGIILQNERANRDRTRAIKHIEHLTDEQFEAVRYSTLFDFMSGDDLDNMLKSPEWD